MLLRLLIFLKLLERSLTNQPQRRTLGFESSYYWPTYNDWYIQMQALLPTLLPDMEWWTRLLQYSVGRNCVGWFNLAATTRVESRKPIKFILPTINIQFTRPIFPVIRKPFCDTNWVYQAYFSYSHTKPNKLFFILYPLNLQATMNQCKYQYKYIGTGYTL